MEEILEKTLLYDFYGELLTEHQKTIYEAAVFDDLSLSEIAETQGISRQGVHDMIRRCNHILTGYEQKLHLVEKFEANRKAARDIYSMAEELRGFNCSPEMRETLEKISVTAKDMLEEI